MKSFDIEERVNLAVENFESGYNCAQSVFLAYADVFELDIELAKQMSVSFGGGVGRMREICGTVSAMAMLAGFKYPVIDPHDQEARARNYGMVQKMADLFKEKTGYDVEVVVGNGAETMSRIEAEKSNPQWDVVWMDSMYDIYNLNLDGQILKDVDVENAAGLTDFFSALVPEDKCFYPTGAHSAGIIVYRNDVWSEEDAPKSYEDLTDAKYKDAIAMADPGVAAPAYPLAAYFMDEMGMDGGEEYFTTLFENGLKVYPKNPQVVEALGSGEVSIAMLQESNAYSMIAEGEPITIVWPENGAAASTRVAAISSATDQPDIAKAFINFLLDPEVQQALVDAGDEGFFTPSVDGVTTKEEREADPKLAVADVAFGAENEADIKAWFADYSAQ